MTTKPRTLAWRLIQLLGKYSEQDIQTALDMLKSGAILSTSVAFVEEIAKTDTQSVMKDELTKEKLKEIIGYENTSDQESILGFVLGILRREYLRTPRMLRDYASLIEIQISKKLPSRAVMTTRITEKLLHTDPVTRASLLEVGRRMDEQSASTLQEWSNLIVR